ncbi:hypothetical protein [Ponticoccus litoralis]|uniref:Uncharacterized protein n=1 Tax=Ponticoccus litoralis TaxID=422297 RepID=A0AAW9SGJ0_9RHOB
MDSGVPMNQRPKHIRKEGLIAELVVEVLRRRPQPVPHIGQDTGHAAPHPGKDQLVVVDVVAHDVEATAGIQPVRDRQQLFCIHARIGVAADEDVDIGVVRGREPPHRADRGIVFAGHQDDLRAIGLQGVPGVLRHRGVAVETRRPADVKMLGDLRVHQRAGDVFRAIAPERKRNDVPVPPLGVEAAPARLDGQVLAGRGLEGLMRQPVLQDEVPVTLGLGLFLAAHAP